MDRLIIGKIEELNKMNYASPERIKNALIPVANVTKQLAEKDAEITRLREENRKLKAELKYKNDNDGGIFAQTLYSD